MTGALETVETWLVDECERLAGSVFRSIESGPGEWSQAYLERVIKSAPAIRVVWEGGEAQEPANELTVLSRWTVYVVTRWDGSRRNARLDPARGAYRACELLAPILHNSKIPDIGLIRVTGIANLWGERIDRGGVAAYGIGLGIPIPLDPDEPALAGNFHDFLTAGIDWNLPGVGENVDTTDTVTLPGA